MLLDTLSESVKKGRKNYVSRLIPRAKNRQEEYLRLFRRSL